MIIRLSVERREIFAEGHDFPIYRAYEKIAGKLFEGELSGLLGSFIPFAKTKAERRKNGDPRLSIEERYQDRKDYVQQISRAARLLVERRYLLAEDAEQMIAESSKTKSVPEKQR